MSPRIRNLLLTSSALLALGTVPGAAGPDGPAVVGGAASVSGAGTSSVTVNQTSNRAIINWSTFNLGTGESARFNQPNSTSVVLNRVTGGLGTSTIDGTLSANGRVFIINRDGILFGNNATINTASFLATTHDIRNEDFMAGRMNFNIPGRSDASIVNLGRITAETGGFAALVAPGVRNSGTITANLGTVALASGNMFTLDMYGDRLIQLGVNDAIAAQVIDVQTGKPLKSLVTNEGKLKANGGRVELTAVQARAVVDSVINTKGVIEANSVGMRNGKIVLGGATASSKSAGAPRQVVKVSGKISVAGKKQGTTGGTVLITGEDIQFANAVIDASGRAGGGKVLIGGDWGGGNPDRSLVNNASAALENYTIDHASTVTVDGATRIYASARDSGQGGKVILWSDVATTFAGVIEARGGAQGGDGGFVEVSSKHDLAYAGLTDTRAPNGRAGTLLLDPDDYVIDSTAAATIVSNLAAGNVVIQTTAGGTGGVGDITVNSAITWIGGNSLTLSAYKDINVNADITNTTGRANVILRADNTGRNVGTVNFSGGTTPDISTGGDVSIFYNPTNYVSPTSYADHGAGGASLTAYMLVNDAGHLQDISTNLGGTYALGRNIDATGFSGYGSGTYFTGLFDGNGGLGINHTISNLSLTSSVLNGQIGLFPNLYNTATVRNLNLSDVSVTAGANGQTIGGLVGINGGGTISNVSVTGTVNGTGFQDITAGGLVGTNSAGTITNAHAAVDVNIGDGSPNSPLPVDQSNSGKAHAGGLVGLNTGSPGDHGIITLSSASGGVAGDGNTFIGGLVGTNETNGDISQSSATGAVQVISPSLHYAAAAGGLVGDNLGSITTSYATGDIGQTGQVKVLSVGGLVGFNRLGGSITTSYASGNVAVANSPSTPTDSSQAGGLVGNAAAGSSITDAYALGSVTVSTTTAGYNLYAGGFVGFNLGNVTRGYSTGAVAASGAGTNTIGGFFGQTDVGAITNSYWDIGTSGQTNAYASGPYPGITGLSTTNAFTQSSYGGFDFSTTWFMVDGLTRPFLRTEQTTTITNAHQLQLMAMDVNYSYTLANDIADLAAGLASPSGMWRNGSFATIGGIGSPFNGVLDGAGHTINGLTINSSAQYVGLFGVIGANAAVRDLNFADAHIGVTGSPARQAIGILAGQNDGSITRVGTVGTNNTVNAGTHTAIQAGGLVGLNTNSIAGVVGTGTDVNVAVTIGSGGDPNNGHNGEWNYAGGLAGTNTGTITDMRAGGPVTSGNFSFAGGLVGENGNSGNPGGNAALIQNSSASGTVTSDHTAGGLAGVNFIKSDGTTTATISNSHATGNVVLNAGGFSAGGLVGQNEGTIQSSYYAGTVSAAGSNNSGAGIGGLVGSNRTFVAGHEALITDSYSSGSVTGGAGTDVGGLVGFNAGRVTNSYSISAVSGSGFTVGGFVGFNADAQSTSSGNISGSYAQGPVAGSSNATTGGFAGWNADGATISNSYATGAVTIAASDFEGRFGGGFVGENEGQITNSYATGPVSGTGGAISLGGFAGVNDPGAVITGAYATGNVSANNSMLAFAGGFVGLNGGLVTQSHATGNVNVDALVGVGGGFVGLNLLGNLTLSYAAGNVTGGDVAFLGGFAGLNAANINQAYAIGAVSGGATSVVGGFVGVNVGVPGFLPGGISQSYALSPTTGGPESFVGGFAGFNFGSLDQVYAVGQVIGGPGSTTGGLVAASPASFTLPDIPNQGGPSPTVTSGGTATNSYWDRQTTGQETSAGGTALDTAVLAGGLPPGFDPSIWAHGSYPQLVNLGPPQNTTPGPPVLPPQQSGQQSDQPSDQQADQVRATDAPSIVLSQLTSDLFFRALTLIDPLIVPPLAPTPPSSPTQTQTQTQQPTRTGQIGPNGPIPGQIDAGPGRFFFVPPPGETRFISNQVMLQIPANVTLAQLEAVARELGLTIIASERIGILGTTAYQFQIADGRPLADIIHALVEKQIINGAQPIYTYVLTQEPTPAGQSEPDLSGRSREGDAAQYVLDKLRLAQIHRTVKGTNIKIAVIDSQVDATHPDIKDNIVARYDATGAEEKPHAHGTGMTGAIVSHSRLMGIAPGAQIAAIHAFGSGVSAESTTFNILKGLDWAANNGVRIINMSFAGPRDPSLERAIKVAHDKGIVLIGAAGNAGPRSPPLYPAADRNVIAVTATDVDDKLFRGANRGPYITIAAPGVDILVPAPDKAYQMTTGTSVATAHISGIVALLLERNPQLKPEDVRKILAASAKRLGPNNEFGAGLVDPVKALELAAPRQASSAPTPGR